MDDSRTKIISDIEAGENVVSVRSPFRLYKDQTRRYIRLEISEPIEYAVLKDESGGFWPQGDGPAFRGNILNLSAGGVLIESNDPVAEGALVVISMSLQEVEELDGIVGLVKRAVSDNGQWLVGIEFVPNEYLQDGLSAAELDVIPENLTSFDERLSNVLSRYVYYRKVSGADDFNGDG